MCKVLSISDVQFGVLGVVGMYILTRHFWPDFPLIPARHGVATALASSVASGSSV
jgi:hypothetical protein